MECILAIVQLSILFSFVSTQDGEIERRFACWGSVGPPVVSAQCHKNTVLHIIRAGLKIQKKGGTTCEFNENDCGCTSDQPGCQMPDVEDLCMSKLSCRLDVTQQYLDTGNCKGFSDYMFIEYKCVQDTEEASQDICMTATYEQEIGFLQTPNYPNTYPDNRHCECSLNVDTGTSIELSILDLRLADDSCKNDQVTILFNGQITKFCGQSNGLQEKIQTNSQNVKIVFDSDQEHGENGFWIKYEANRPVKVSCKSLYKPMPAKDKMTKIKNSNFIQPKNSHYSMEDDHGEQNKNLHDDETKSNMNDFEQITQHFPYGEENGDISSTTDKVPIHLISTKTISSVHDADEIEERIENNRKMFEINNDMIKTDDENLERNTLVENPNYLTDNTDYFNDSTEKESENDEFQKITKEVLQNEEFQQNTDEESENEKYQQNTEEESENEEFQHNREEESENEEFQHNREEESENEEFQHNREEESENEEFYQSDNVVPVNEKNIDGSYSEKQNINSLSHNLKQTELMGKETENKPIYFETMEFTTYPSSIAKLNDKNNIEKLQGDSSNPRTRIEVGTSSPNQRRMEQRRMRQRIINRERMNQRNNRRKLKLIENNVTPKENRLYDRMSFERDMFEDYTNQLEVPDTRLSQNKLSIDNQDNEDNLNTSPSVKQRYEDEDNKFPRLIQRNRGTDDNNVKKILNNHESRSNRDKHFRPTSKPNTPWWWKFTATKDKSVIPTVKYQSNSVLNEKMKDYNFNSQIPHHSSEKPIQDFKSYQSEEYYNKKYREDTSIGVSSSKPLSDNFMDDVEQNNIQTGLLEGIKEEEDRDSETKNKAQSSTTVTIIAVSVISMIIIIIVVGLVVRWVLNKREKKRALRHRHKKECAMRQQHLRQSSSQGRR